MTLPALAQDTLAPLIAAFRSRRPLRAGSLIITVFGDTISQHGNCVWLGSLIRALAPLGLSERLIRTSVYRLSQDDWLTSEQIGRRSYYSFSAKGLRSYRSAAQRIYNLGQSVWDGQWMLVLAGFLTDRERDALRRELQWLGYGTLSPGMMAHPSHDRTALDETLADMNLAGKVTVLSAQTEDDASLEVPQQLAVKSWKLKELGESYRAFCSAYQPSLQALEDGELLSDHACFLLRTLLIHDYRRLLLRDADLPDELLAETWPGREALALTTRLYQLLAPTVTDYVCHNLEGKSGLLPGPGADFAQRFSAGNASQ